VNSSEQRAERSVSQLDIDLAIFADSSDAENFADAYVVGDEDSLSDVEPDSPSKVSVLEHQHERKLILGTALIPEIVA